MEPKKRQEGNVVAAKRKEVEPELQEQLSTVPQKKLVKTPKKDTIKQASIDKEIIINEVFEPLPRVVLAHKLMPKQVYPRGLVEELARTQVNSIELKTIPIKVKAAEYQPKSAKVFEDYNPNIKEVAAPKLASAKSIVKPSVRSESTAKELTYVVHESGARSIKIDVPAALDAVEVVSIANSTNELPMMLPERQPIDGAIDTPGIFEAQFSEFTANLLDDEGVVITTSDILVADTIAAEDDLLSLARQEIGITGELVDITYEDKNIPNIRAEMTVIRSEEKSVEPAIVELFHEFQQKVAELEPAKTSEIVVHFEELVNILARPEILDTTADVEVEGEDRSEIIQDKLKPVVTEIFQSLGIEIEEPQIARIVQLLIAQKETFIRLKQQDSSDRGTHEILSHIASLIAGVKCTIESLPNLLGQLAMSSAYRQKQVLSQMG